jgi:hypothetical protein
MKRLRIKFLREFNNFLGCDRMRGQIEYAPNREILKCQQGRPLLIA